MNRTLLFLTGLSVLAAGAPLTQYNDGVAQLEQGRVAEAITALEAAAVSSEGPLRAAALFNLGLAHALEGDALRDATPEQGETRDSRIKRLTAAAGSYRTALAFFRRVPPPAQDANEGARASKVRLLAVLDQIQKLADEARREAEEEALSNPPLLLLATLAAERDRRRAAAALQTLDHRHRRSPAHRLRQAEFEARTLMEKLASALREPPADSASAPQPVPIPEEVARAAAAAVQRGALAMAEAEGRLDGGDGAGAVLEQSRAIAELGAAARMLPLLLPQLVDRLLADQRSLLGLTGSGDAPLLATEESEVRVWLAALTDLPDPEPAPQEGAGGLTAETTGQIRTLAGEAEAAAGRAEEHLRAKRTEDSRPEQETVIVKLEEIRDLLPRPPESPAERIRKLIGEEGEVKEAGEALAGMNDEARKQEAAGLGERQTGNGREAGSIAEQLEASPGEREKSAAGKVREAEEEIHASGESFRRNLPEPADEAIDRAIASLEEALRILSGEENQDQQRDSQKEPQDSGEKEQPEPKEQDARRLDSREARRLMEEMDRERREEERKLFRGIGGPKVEKDW